MATPECVALWGRPYQLIHYVVVPAKAGTTLLYC